MRAAADSLRYRKDIVLVGGGHSHALVALQWAMNPISEARVTLISEQGVSPYSGMLPGAVAGHYSVTDIHVDLHRLCHYAGIRFVCARVIGVDATARQVLLEGRPPIEYDLLSINAGITPDISVEGAADHAVPVKPISRFLPRWEQVCAQLQTATGPSTVAVVGGGAGSVELVFAMAERLRYADTRHQWVLVTRSPQLLPEYPSRLRAQLQHRLQNYGIRVMTASEVTGVTASALTVRNSASGGEQTLAVDHVFWCTQARPPAWLAQSGLAVTAQGYLAVNECLQSESHPEVFGAGDCAWLTAHALPRAGVYAVRQAPVLRENLRRKVLGQALQPYRPQRHFLSLLACGGRDAVGARGRWSVAGAWVWRLKDRIDRRFMRMFHELPVLSPLPENDAETLATAQERCGGCGGKVGGDLLRQALTALDTSRASEPSYCALAPAEDAAVLTIPNGGDRNNDWHTLPIDRPDNAGVPLLVQSVDALKPLFDDPWLFARIATVHALSDLFAMNATPHSAQLLLQLPVLRPRLQQRDLQQILLGVRHELEAHGATLAGGHTLEAESLQIGLTVNAFCVPAALLRKRGVRAGDKLVLTKPLGTGVVYAAAMRGFMRAEWLQATVVSMLSSNALAIDSLVAAGAHALTDVTGFGLAGHLLEMLANSSLDAHLSLAAVPVLSGAQECLLKGYESTLAPANRRLAGENVITGDSLQVERYKLLFDPQTSGGLLAAIAPENVDTCLKMLTAAGVNASVIGESVAGGKGRILCC